MVVSAGADKDIDPNNATERMYLNFMDSGGLDDPVDQLGKTQRLTAFILLGTVSRVKFFKDRRSKESAQAELSALKETENENDDDPETHPRSRSSTCLSNPGNLT
jgi:hypothetical protein